MRTTWLSRWSGLSGLCGVLTALVVQTASAEFLPPDQAFAFQAVSTAQDQATLTWKIANDYYLYHDQLKVIEGEKTLSLKLPKPQQKDDPNFGMTAVHYGQVQATVPMKANQSYKIEWQGCAESGLCYPVQRTTIQTDADGLLPASNLSAQGVTKKKLLDAVTSAPLLNVPMPIEAQAKKVETFESKATQADVENDAKDIKASSEPTALTEPSEASAPEQDDALSMQENSESNSTDMSEQRTNSTDWN